MSGNSGTLLFRCDNGEGGVPRNDVRRAGRLLRPHRALFANALGFPDALVPPVRSPLSRKLSKRC